MNFRFGNGNKSKARQKFEFSAKEASPPGADFQVRGLIVFQARHRRKCPNFPGINYEACISMLVCSFWQLLSAYLTFLMAVSCLVYPSMMFGSALSLIHNLFLIFRWQNSNLLNVCSLLACFLLLLAKAVCLIIENKT